MHPNRLLKRTLVAFAALVVALTALAVPQTALAADRSSDLEITDLWIVDSGGVQIDLDKGNDTSAYSNGLGFGEQCGWGFTWKLVLSGGDTLHEGDEVKLRFSFPDTAGGDFAPVPLYDEGGTNIGTLLIQRADITMTFNSAVEGKTSLTGGRCQTSIQYSRQTPIGQPELRRISLRSTGGLSDSMTSTYLAEANKLNLMTTSDLTLKNSLSTSNNVASWYMTVGLEAERNLTNGWETKYYDDLLIEDTVQGDFPLVQIGIKAAAPVSGSATPASWTALTSKTITEKFNLLTQQDGESLDQFRERIKAQDLNYGVYKDEATGQSTMLIYFGKFPNAKLGTWEENGMFAAVRNATDDLWTDVTKDDRKEQWMASHGTDNAYGGVVNYMHIAFRTSYDPVVVDTTVKNTAVVSFNGKTETPTSSATLKPASGQATPQEPTVAELLKFDEATGAVIKGAKFRLEWRTPGQSSWNAYAGAKVYTTGDDGMLKIANLPKEDREYRFVEYAPATGYDPGSQKYYATLDGEQIQGEVHFATSTSDTEGHLLYCSNKKTQYGDVVISKSLEGNTQDANHEFEVTVTATLDGSPVSGTHGDAEFENGEATLRIKGGESKTVAQLQEDTVYTVKEADYGASGYETSYKNASGGDIRLTDGRVQGTVGASSRDYVRIVNERNTYGTIKVTKSVAGNAGDLAKQFDFNVAFRNPDGSPMANATLGQGLVTDSNGELSFSLSQEDGAKVIGDVPNGATYEISEDPDGYVATVPANATGTIVGGADPVEVPFTNTLDTYADVTVRKVLAGNDASSGATKAFEFAVTAADAKGAPLEGEFGDATFTAGQATLKVTGAGTATIRRLPNGATYTIAEADYSAEGWAASWDVEPTGRTVVGGTNATHTVTNTRDTYSSLMVAKEVAGNAADPNEEFSFKVTVADAGGATTEETFSLRGGGSKRIENLPNAAVYEVVETDARGYESEVTEGSATGIIEGGVHKAVTFTNTRNTFGDLTISKAVAGDNPGRVESFDFTVTAADAKGAPLVGDFGGVAFTGGTARVSVAPGAPVTIAGLPNGATYRVEEDDYSADGYATSSEGAEGTIAGGETSTASFTNTRSADGTLTVSKAVAGTAVRADDRFSFEVVLDDDAVSGEYSGVAFEGGRATLELAGGESATIEGLPHGTGWTVAEVDALDYEPDAAELSGTVDEDAPSVAAFTNRRSYAPVTVDPPLRKVVEGTDAADEFTFLMRAVSTTVPGMTPATMPMPEGSEGGAKRVTRAGAGEYEFGEFQIALPGTYAYEMSEVPGTLFYDYDPSTYAVTYEVVADGLQLRATRTIARDGEPVESATFTNVRVPDFGVAHRYEGDHPEDVAATLPTDPARYRDGSVVSPMPPAAESVEAEGGTWAFRGWDAESKTVEGADVEFVGTWEFVAEKDDPKKEDPKKEEKKEQGQSSGGTSSGGTSSGGSSASSASRAATPATADASALAWAGLSLAGLSSLAAGARRRR